MIRLFENPLCTFGLAMTLALSSCTEETIINNPVPDLRPPLVEWVSVNGRIDFQSVVRDTVLLTLSASDPSGIDSVKLYVNGFARFTATSPTPPSIEGGDFVFLWNTLADSDGVYSLEAHAWDMSGTSGAGVSPVLLLRVSNTTPPPPPDRTPPVIRWIAPLAGSVARDTVEFNFIVKDSSETDSVKVFVDGEVEVILAGQADTLYTVLWNSWRWANGRHIVEVRAWDSAGNAGIGDPVGVTVDNHKVIWVPDDFGTIQASINASVDGDTVRVRAGTYREGVRIIGKSIWLESQSGAEHTLIDGTGIDTIAYASGMYVAGARTNLTVRGLTVTGGEFGILTYDEGSINIYNCIVYDQSRTISGIDLYGGGTDTVLNCLVDGAHRGISAQYNSGQIFNSILINCDIGYFKTATYNYWMDYGWNLFWNNDENYRYEYPKESDVFADPQFIPGSYIPGRNSPASNHGNPKLIDKDGSRSDIGIYGGLYAY